MATATATDTLTVTEVKPRKGWAEAFSKIKKKEQMLIPETIDSNNFKWKW